MKLNLFVAAALALGGLSAMGAELSRLTLDHDEVCKKVNLTDEQKAAIDTAHTAFKKNMVQLKADAKTAFINYEESVSNVATVRADADAAATAINDAVGKVVAAKTAHVTAVLYDILQPEQRGPAIDCLKAKKKHHDKDKDKDQDDKDDDKHEGDIIGE